MELYYFLLFVRISSSFYFIWIFDTEIFIIFKNIKNKMKIITKTGEFLLFTGILILTNQLQVIGFYLLELLPFLSNVG